MPTVYVEVESGIPMVAGLGSSAAATVAGLRLFEKVAHPLSTRELLAAATSLEGHADNAAPALLGGLTSVVADEGHAPEALHWTWPDELRLVVATPSMALATAKAASTRSAHCTRATDGVKAAFTMSIWAGWIRILPAKPSAAAASASCRSPSESLGSGCGVSIAGTPIAPAATSTWARANTTGAGYEPSGWRGLIPRSADRSSAPKQIAHNRDATPHRRQA